MSRGPTLSRTPRWRTPGSRGRRTRAPRSHTVTATRQQRRHRCASRSRGASLQHLLGRIREVRQPGSPVVCPADSAQFQRGRRGWGSSLTTPIRLWMSLRRRRAAVRPAWRWPVRSLLVGRGEEDRPLQRWQHGSARRSGKRPASLAGMTWCPARVAPNWLRASRRQPLHRVCVG